MKNKFFKNICLILLSSFLFVSNFNITLANEVASNTELVSENKFILTEEEYKRKTALELSELVKTKKVTSEELVKIAYSIIEKENKELNAVISTRKEEALEEARALDKLPDEEKNKKVFLGVPTLMKGFGHNVKGQPATYGYMFNKDNIFKSDNSITKQFKNLGFVVLGMTNYPEGAMRNITDSKLYGNAKNPFNKNHNAGGSSGGSASAVASGMVAVASGSDIGGSIRIPASWTGLIGLKPTSETGYAVHFPLVKSVDDAREFLNHTIKLKSGFVEVDDIKTLKIGYTTKIYDGMKVSEDSKKALQNAVEFLKQQGFILEEIKYPVDARYMLEQYTNVATAGIKDLDKKLKEKNLTKYDVDPLTWSLYIYTKDIDKKELSKNKKTAEENIKKQVEIFKEFHKNYPVILTPTSATLAPLNSDYYVTDEMKEILYNFENINKEDRFNLLVKQWEPMFNRTPYTLISNLTKEPSISLPTYLSKNNLPLGILLNAPFGYDKVLLDFAKLFEDNNMFKMNKEIIKKVEEEKETPKGEKNKNLETILGEQKTQINKNLETISKKQEINEENKKQKSNEKKLPNTGVAEQNYNIIILITLFVILAYKKQKTLTK